MARAQFLVPPVSVPKERKSVADDKLCEQVIRDYKELFNLKVQNILKLINKPTPHSTDEIIEIIDRCDNLFVFFIELIKERIKLETEFQQGIFVALHNQFPGELKLPHEVALKLKSFLSIDSLEGISLGWNCLDETIIQKIKKARFFFAKFTNVFKSNPNQAEIEALEKDRDELCKRKLEAVEKLPKNFSKTDMDEINKEFDPKIREKKSLLASKSEEKLYVPRKQDFDRLKTGCVDPELQAITDRIDGLKKDTRTRCVSSLFVSARGIFSARVCYYPRKFLGELDDFRKRSFETPGHLLEDLRALFARHKILDDFFRLFPERRKARNYCTM